MLFSIGFFFEAYLVGGINLSYVISLIVYALLYTRLVGIKRNERRKLAFISIIGILIVSSYLLVHSMLEFDNFIHGS